VSVCGVERRQSPCNANKGSVIGGPLAPIRNSGGQIVDRPTFRVKSRSSMRHIVNDVQSVCKQKANNFSALLADYEQTVILRYVLVNIKKRGSSKS
jgi:hypothetical protein